MHKKTSELYTYKIDLFLIHACMSIKMHAYLHNYMYAHVHRTSVCVCTRK